MKTVKKWVLGLVSVAMGLGVWAAGVEYVDADGTTKTCETYTVVTDATKTFEDGGWYVVESGAELMCGMIAVNGSAHLILADGAQLMAAPGSANQAGIRVEVGNSLTIYGQSEGSGKLTAYGWTGGAGIGGGKAGDCGTVTVNGGTVTATGANGGAGIGGGHGGAGGCVMVNGGEVTAVGSTDASGIGGGYGNFTNGTLSAAAAVYVKAGAGVTNYDVKRHGEHGEITLKGERYFKTGPATPVEPIDYVDGNGEVKTCGDYVVVTEDVGVFSEDQWYVVLPGRTVSRDAIEVSGSVKLILGDGAQLVANASEEMYRSGVQVSEGNALTVYGQAEGSGKLTARGWAGAGIGGSRTEHCGVVTINGGVVSATGDSGGAGIGGSSDCNGGTVTINRGTVTANGGGNGGAGIGGGNGGAGGEVYIYGGAVTATGLSGAAGIGRGSGNTGDGTLNVGIVVVVKAGSKELNAGVKAPGPDWSIALGGEPYYRTFCLPGPFAIEAAVAPGGFDGVVTVMEQSAATLVVPVSVTTLDNWTFLGWTGIDGSGAEIAFLDATALTTTFVMPETNVTITANFAVSDACRSDAVEAVEDAAATAIAAIDAMNLTDAEKANYAEAVNWVKTEMLERIANAATPTEVRLTKIMANGAFDFVVTGAQEYADQVWEIEACVATADDAGTVTVAETSQARLAVDVSAAASEHWTFVGWTGVDGSGTEVFFADATAPATTFVMPETNVTVTANFVLAEDYLTAAVGSVEDAAAAAIAAIGAMNLTDDEKGAYEDEIADAKELQLAVIAAAAVPADVEAAVAAAGDAFEAVRARAQEYADRPVDPPPPVDPEPVDPEPVDPEPVDPTPVDPSPVDPEPADPQPIGPQPVDPQPVDPTPVGPAPVEPPVDEPAEPEIPLYTEEGEINPQSDAYWPPELFWRKAATEFAGNVTYNGWLRDSANGSLKGTLTIKSGKPNKKTGISKLTVTYIPFGQKKHTIKLAKDAMPVVGGNPVVDLPGLGSVKFGGDSLEGLDINVQSGADLSKNAQLKAAYNARIAAKAGVWSFAFNTDLGYAAFSVTVDKKGKGKLVGSLPDGTKVSLSAKGVLGEEALAIPFAYAKKASFGFVFWLDDGGRVSLSDVTPVKLATGTCAVNSWTEPSRVIALADGAHTFQFAGVEQSFTVAGKKWSFPKQQKKLGADDPNPYGTKLAFTPKTGMVKGNVSLVPSTGGKPVKYTVNGVVVNGRLCGSASAKGHPPLKVVAK